MRQRLRQPDSRHRLHPSDALYISACFEASRLSQTEISVVSSIVAGVVLFAAGVECFENIHRIDETFCLPSTSSLMSLVFKNVHIHPTSWTSSPAVKTGGQWVAGKDASQGIELGFRDIVLTAIRATIGDKQHIVVGAGQVVDGANIVAATKGAGVEAIDIRRDCAPSCWPAW